jgi:hypothetical protein
MTKAEALRALAGMGLTRKMAGFLLSEAEKHGCGAHLKCEVTYAEGHGYAIVDYRESGSGGLWVTPGTVNG